MRTRPQQCFDTELSGVWKSAAPKLYALPSRELPFSSCPHGHQFVVREARLQMVKISKRSVGKLKSYEH